MSNLQLLDPLVATEPGEATGSWLDTAAALLGLRVEELLGAFSDGLTLAEIADARSVDVGILADTILDGLDEHVYDLVERCGVAVEDADELRHRLVDHVADVIDEGWVELSALSADVP